MDIIQGIFTRRSIRKFTGVPVTDEQLETLLKAGFCAPSAHNSQPWHFIVVRDEETLGHIAANHTYAKMLPSAGSCIIVCGDEEVQKSKGFLIEDCSAAIQNILLAAHGLGLGAVWCGLYPVSQLTQLMSEALNLPPHITPIGMVVVGNKSEDREPADRYDKAKIHYNKW